MSSNKSSIESTSKSSTDSSQEREQETDLTLKPLSAECQRQGTENVKTVIITIEKYLSIQKKKNMVDCPFCMHVSKNVPEQNETINNDLPCINKQHINITSQEEEQANSIEQKEEEAHSIEQKEEELAHSKEQKEELAHFKEQKEEANSIEEEQKDAIPLNMLYLFERYSAYLYCLLRHCHNPTYNHDILITFFNLEIFLLAQIAQPPESFYNAYKRIDVLPIVLEYIKKGNIHKIDHMMHINREEEIESLTYKYYKRTYTLQGGNGTNPLTPFLTPFPDNSVTDQSSNGHCKDGNSLIDPSTLVCLLLYQRNEPHRFFKLYYSNKNVITHRIAVLLTIHHPSIISDGVSDGVSEGKKVVLSDCHTTIPLKQLYDEKYIQSLRYMAMPTECNSLEDRSTTTSSLLSLLYVSDQVRNMPMGFFSKLNKKFSLDRITRENHEITYNAVLTHFNNITVKKRKYRNSLEFRKWYKREKRDRQWKELISIWVNNRNVAVDLSMMDICTEYGEYEKGHYIYEHLLLPCLLNREKQNSDNDRQIEKDRLTKYTNLCITALKHGNSAQVLAVNQSKKKDHHLNTIHTILNDCNMTDTHMQTLTEIKNHNQQECMNMLGRPDGVVENNTERTNVNVESNTERNVESNNNLNVNVNATENESFNYKSNSCIVIQSATNSTTSTTSNDNNTYYDTLWTERLLSVAAQLKKKRKDSQQTVMLVYTALITNILYFKTDTRRSVIDLLLEVNMTDQMIQTVLSLLYDMVVSYHTYISNDTLNSGDLTRLCDKLYRTFKNNQSFFKRTDQKINESIYCCMLGVCHETECKTGFLSICNDLKGSSTTLNNDMIKIIKNYHSVNHCNCNWFDCQNKQTKKNVIKHVIKHNMAFEE